MTDRISVRPLPVYHGPHQDNGPKRLLLQQGEFTLLHAACPSIRFLAFLTFLRDVPRGNHYHPSKTEYFYLLRGRIVLKTRDRETGQLAEAELKAGDLLTLAPNVEHLYIPSEASEAIEFSDTPWSPEDTVKTSL